MRRHLFILILFLLQLSNLAPAAIPSQERAALIALYNLTGGDDWGVNGGWKTPPLHTDGFAMPGTEGTWFGITLSEDHVTEIKLNGNQLKGSIPPELTDLTHLKFINLSGMNNYHMISNFLSGSIPPELGNLSHLQELDLSWNELNGGIPPELGNLGFLQKLNLYSNQLSGIIPSEFGNFSNLKELHLGMNKLSGNIPPDWANIRELQVLNLYSNYLSGPIPPELGNLSHLQVLFLSDNQLSGGIPPELGNLKNITYFDLSRNQLSGSIPVALGTLSHLNYLYLYYNQLSGSIPQELGNLSRLNSLYLDHNQLSGSIPLTLAKLSNIYLLDIGYNCLSVTDPTLRVWLNVHDPDWEEHQCGSGIRLSQTQLHFGMRISDSGAGVQTIRIHNTGSGPLNWSASADTAWISLNPSSGTGDSVISVSVNPEILMVGGYSGTIRITDPEAFNSPQAITVSLQVYGQGTTLPPFGEFSTPQEGAILSNSIAVTGWALDDLGVSSVKIYNGDTCVSDAVFVEGARPDVETAFPEFPMNDKAGWGCMLLTHLLPNGGNGTYTLIAKAVDREGNESRLGSKTIIIDNAHSVNPFGTIDTPIPCETLSGKDFLNFGWALTPQPHMIPIDGSTIDVVVDGVIKGHPAYNIFRSDIASLFQGYANSNGALGYYYLDTETLSNGMHTISWNVKDNAGNIGGIGSRYFTVWNTGVSSETASRIEAFDSAKLGTLPEEGETVRIEIKELERVEIKLSGQDMNGEFVEGYLMIGDRLTPLPVGSTLDNRNGVFYWQPGPGFTGEYHLIFIGKDHNGQYVKKNIIITIIAQSFSTSSFDRPEPANTPPLIAQAPTNITTFGSGTALYVSSTANAMFSEIGPVITIPSACRGDATNSIPNRCPVIPS